MLCKANKLIAGGCFYADQPTIQELRQRAETLLGTRFNFKASHEQVLNTGGVPLAILKQKIERWIAAEAAK